MDQWYKTSFSQDYLRIYQHRDDNEAKHALDNLLSHLEIPDNAICLDLCCGFGRHLSYLNSKGIKTFGVDLSRDLIRSAQRTFPVRNRLALADMRALPFHPRFDFVFSFFSRFGYFDSDDENVDVLEQIQRILKPNAGFLIDYLNAEYTRKNLKPADRQDFGDFSLYQKRWINSRLNAVEKKLVIEDKDGERTMHERVKLYELKDFEEFCKRAKLTISGVLGDYTGGPHNSKSDRLIIFGKKL